MPYLTQSIFLGGGLIHEEMPTLLKLKSAYHIYIYTYSWGTMVLQQFQIHEI